MLRNLPKATQQSPVLGLLDLCLQGLCYMLCLGPSGVLGRWVGMWW